MAQQGFDTLMALTKSRYKLSMIVSRRAAQLKQGFPSVLPKEQIPRTRNTVTIAMRELEVGKGLEWGNDLPTTAEQKSGLERERRDESSYSVSREPLVADSDLD